MIIIIIIKVLNIDQHGIFKKSALSDRHKCNYESIKIDDNIGRNLGYFSYGIEF